MTPDEILRELLIRADAPLDAASLLTAAELDGWPSGLAETLVRTETLAVDEPAPTVQCDACDEGHWEEPEWLADDREHAYIPCPTHGSARVEAASLRRWRVDVEGITRSIAQQIGARRAPQEVIPHRVWKLGRVHIAGRPLLGLIARGVTWVDCAAVIAAVVDGFKSPLVLSFDVPDPRGGISALWLGEVLRIDRSGIQLDWPTLEEHCSFMNRSNAGVDTKPAFGDGARASAGGRPAGYSIGALLSCWLDCHSLVKQFGSVKRTYDAVDEFLSRHPDPKVVVPLRIAFPSARSYARRSRGDRPCSWYRHKEGVPSEILSE